MEWVETTGKTVDEAVDLALDQLGVDRDDADIEVLEEPKSGLFGRLRSEARVRARVRPTKPRAKEERRDRKAPRSKKADAAVPEAATPSDPAPVEKAAPRRNTRKKEQDVAEAPVAESAPVAAAAGSAVPNADRPARRPRQVTTVIDPQVEEIGVRFLNGLVAAFGLEATVSVSLVGDGITQFAVHGSELGVLIGPKAQTLTAVQELLRTVLHYEADGDAGRVLLDVAGYREKRRAALAAFTRQVVAQVMASGESRALEPMTAVDRKVVHDTVNEIDGVRSTSEGEDPNRRVVIHPSGS